MLVIKEPILYVQNLNESKFHTLQTTLNILDGNSLPRHDKYM